jgi:hypothetical protein
MDLFIDDFLIGTFDVVFMKSLESNWRSPKPIEKASINSIA